MSERIGQQLGNYRLVGLIGQGGFADVYLGEHVYLSTKAAVKVMNAQLATQDTTEFQLEGRTLAQLIHPAIVRVLDFGLEGRTPFLVLDYAPNGTLRQRHPKGTKLPFSLISTYVQQIASGLQYAHDGNLIHRDIKPENILLGRRNEVLLTDFGLAIMAPSSLSVAADQIAGSAGYIAPEQIVGKPRLASDQYSLAVVVYEWLSGRRPFDGTSFLEIATQHLYSPPPPLRNFLPSLSPQLEQVVLKALAKEPQQRYASVQDFANALQQALAAQEGSFAIPPTVQATPFAIDPTVQAASFAILPTVQVQSQAHSQPKLPPKTREQWLAEGNAAYDAQRFEEALQYYEQAISLDGSYAAAFIGKGLALRSLMRFDEALLAYERATQLDPSDPVAYNNKSRVLILLDWYGEAVRAAEQAIQLNPNYALAYYNKGYALGELKRYEEELAAYEQAIQLDASFVLAYNAKGVTLNILRHYDEALAALDRAIELAPTFATAHTNRGNVLCALSRYEEAIAAYDLALQLDMGATSAVSGKSKALAALGRLAEAQQVRHKQ